MQGVDLQRVVTHWEGLGAAHVYTAGAITALLYALAAARPSPRGRRWPHARTICFLGGVALLVASYASGLDIYEDDPAVHVVQHMLVMMAVPPLLAFGAPLTLLLRTLPARGRRAVTTALDDPTLRLWRGRWAGLWLAGDYFGSMYVYQLTPLRSLAERHSGVHVAVHFYFLLCGLVFWLPVAGLDPARYRPRPPTKRLLVAIGVPAFATLGGIELLAGHHATGLAYIASGVALSLAGLLGLELSGGAGSAQRRGDRLAAPGPGQHLLSRDQPKHARLPE
jgi:cytochrome c oxidase assembly factor CtaG